MSARGFRGVRDRHDGAARNPWNEPECGDHYARAMASYGLLQAYAGSHLDLSRGRISLPPRATRDNLPPLFSLEGAGGSFRRPGDRVTIDLAAGALTVRELEVAGR